jgi:hypothetical protein
MPNFANGKIYCIRSHQTDKIYIGSTTQTLAQRFGKHKALNCSSREIMKFEDCYIELLENYTCTDKNELNRREGELIRLHDCINKNIAGRTSTEYYLDNKEQINEKTKQYYQDNKQEILEQSKQYREDNKTEIKEQKKQYYENNIEAFYEKNKQYRTNNKTEIKEQKKQYYMDNIEKIKEKKSKPNICDCGGCYKYGDKSKHFKSKKHIEFIRQVSA